LIFTKMSGLGQEPLKQNLVQSYVKIVMDARMTVITRTMELCSGKEMLWSTSAILATKDAEMPRKFEHKQIARFR